MTQPTATHGPRAEASETSTRAGANPLLDAPIDSGRVRRSMLRGLIKTLRPHQWVKNLFVLAPMFFHKDVFVQTPVGTALNLSVTGRALSATFVFCLIAGAVYTINDIADVAADRVHPVKRFRPIAAGIVPEGIARTLA